MVPTFAVATVSVLATILAPASAPVPASQCAAHLDAGVFRPAWCGKKPPPKSYEKFRKALASFKLAVDGYVEAQAGAIASLQPLDDPCKHNPPVDPDSVTIIVGGLDLNGSKSLQNARTALATMTSSADAIFAGNPNQAEAKSILQGFAGRLNEFEASMNLLRNAGDLLLMTECQAATDAEVKAADDLVATATFINHSLVSLSVMFGSVQTCKSADVKDPYSDKALKRASGSPSVKSMQLPGIAVEYPGSLDLGGAVWLPLNVASTTPSGYVQLELRQGSKPLAAIGGGTPAGESGLRVKVLGKARAGKAKLELTFTPAGGSPVSKTVTVRFS